MRARTYLFESFSATGRRATVLTIAAIFLMFLCPAGAQGAFTGPYELNNFLLLNTNADGTWNSPDVDQTLALIGGNNGSGLEGTTSFLLFAPQTVQISFAFSWSTEDEFLDYDIGGYLAGGDFHALTETQITGTRSFIVPQGQGFGFAVKTLDNWGGAGTLTITNFEAAATAATPEPSTVVPILLAAGAFILSRRWRRSARGAERAL